VIPLRDADHKLWSLEFISPDGTKRFLAGSRKRGCMRQIRAAIGFRGLQTDVRRDSDGR
jgi:phage/plasmid primase-like uncharacterized protein